MNAVAKFTACLRACPLVAILRGVRPNEIDGIADALVAAGFRIIEVPLNSPDPLRSIERLAKRFGQDVLIGAGTVLDTASVRDAANSGGQIIVSPATDVDVIRTAVEAGLVACPGYFTPTEAFLALGAGAQALKLFPAEAARPAVVKAQRAVLPPDVRLLIVGGIKPESMEPWLAAGADGFGLGSALYVAGREAADVAIRARSFIDTLAQRQAGTTQ